jgi:hypothetical protein
MNPEDEHTEPQEPEAQQPEPAPSVQPIIGGESPLYATPVIPPVHGIPTQPLLQMPSAAYSIPLGQAPAPMAQPMYGVPPQAARPPRLPCPPVLPAPPDSTCQEKPSRWNVIIRFLRAARGRQRWKRRAE